METSVYRPRGVCSREVHSKVDGDIIRNATIVSSYADNLLGISRITKGKKINEVLDAFRGVRYGAKPTFCPSQIAEMLSEYTRKLG